MLQCWGRLYWWGFLASLPVALNLLRWLAVGAGRDIYSLPSVTDIFSPISGHCSRGFVSVMLPSTPSTQSIPLGVVFS